MNQKKYLFLTDVDSTLLRRDAPLTEETIAAAREFMEAGGLLGLCTGRSVPAAREVAQKLGVNAPCVLYGGASLYDFEKGEHLYLHSFTGDILSCVEKVLENHPTVSMQVFTRKAVYVLRRTPRLDAKGVQEENIGPEQTVSDVEGDVVKLVMCCDDPAELEACRTYFPEEFCDFAFASRTFADVVARGCSKAEALLVLKTLLGVEADHVIAAGDAMTDLPLLRISCLSFAPANALEAVKAEVTHIVPDVTKSGMAQAFHMAAAYIRSSR